MNEERFVSAIVLAAGKSQRMGFDKLKLKIGGKSVLERTLDVFEESDTIDEIILAAPEEEIEAVNSLVQRCSFEKVMAIVKGGKTRQESVKNAIEAVSAEAEYIAVHDGARPLIRIEDIDAVCRAAYECGGAVAAVKGVDTLKAIDDNMMIVSTIDREKCVQVRTPQVFKKEILVEAHKKASEDGFLGTDECMLAERCGCPIKVVETSRENVKITFPDDIAYVTEILRERGKL
jgi:2-C-methyl-D-erythritol 4-phosphate cytidylyltransferase